MFRYESDQTAAWSIGSSLPCPEERQGIEGGTDCLAELEVQELVRSSSTVLSKPVAVMRLASIAQPGGRTHTDTAIADVRGGDDGVAEPAKASGLQQYEHRQLSHAEMGGRSYNMSYMGLTLPAKVVVDTEVVPSIVGLFPGAGIA